MQFQLLLAIVVSLALGIQADKAPQECSGYDEAEAGATLVRAMILLENGDAFLATPLIDKVVEERGKTMAGRLATSIKAAKYELPKKARVSLTETVKAYALARHLVASSGNSSQQINAAERVDRLDSIQTKLLSYDVYIMVTALKQLYGDLNKVVREYQRQNSEDFQKRRNFENYVNSHLGRRNTDKSSSKSFKSAESLAARGALGISSISGGFEAKAEKEKAESSTEKSTESDKAEQFAFFEMPKQLRDDFDRGMKILNEWADVAGELGRVIDERFSAFMVEDTKVQTLIARGRWEDTVASLKRLTEKDPDSSTYKNTLALAYLHCAKYDEAIVLATEARALDTRSVQSYEIEGLALLKKGDIDGSITTLMIADRMALDKEPAIPFFLAVCYQKQGSAERVEEYADLCCARGIEPRLFEKEDATIVGLIRKSSTLKAELDSELAQFKKSQEAFDLALKAAPAKRDAATQKKIDELWQDRVKELTELGTFVEKKLWRAKKYTWAEEVLGDVKRTDSSAAPICEVLIACVRAASGRIDDAVSSLEAGIDGGYTNVAFLKSTPDLKPLHAHPSWDRLLRKAEEASAKAEAQQKAAIEARKQAAAKFMVLDNVRFEKTSDKKDGVFVDLKNKSDTLMKKVTLTFYYVDDKDKVLFQENLDVQNLKSQEKRSPGLLLRQVKGFKNVKVAITDIDY